MVQAGRLQCCARTLCPSCTAEDHTSARLSKTLDIMRAQPAGSYMHKLGLFASLIFSVLQASTPCCMAELCQCKQMGILSVTDLFHVSNRRHIVLCLHPTISYSLTNVTCRPAHKHSESVPLPCAGPYPLLPMQGWGPQADKRGCDRGNRPSHAHSPSWHCLHGQHRGWL